MTMKKKSNAARLGALVLALTLVTTCLLGGTMARYVTEVTGTAKATVAAWKFDAKNGNNSITEKTTSIDLGSTTNRTAYEGTDIKEGVIAPGNTGSFDIVIDGTGSEVGVDYAMKIAAASGTTLPDGLKFEVANGTNATATVYTLGKDEVTGTIDYSETDSNMKKTLTVSWAWDFGEKDTKDSNDNTYEDQEWVLDITVTGKQATPEEDTTTT